MPSRKANDHHLSVAKAAIRLGVSGATVRNWFKTGLLSPLDLPGPIVVAADEVEALLIRLRHGKANGKLRSRANKTQADDLVLPGLAFLNREDRAKMKGALGKIASLRLKPATAIFLVGLNRLAAAGLLTRTEARLIASGSVPPCGRGHLLAELADFRRLATRENIPEEAFELLTAQLPGAVDVLGLFRQALSPTGARAHRGLFYTPSTLAESVAKTVFRPGIDILDPCCGSGSFLVAFARLGADPERLTGFDLDPLAVKIACLNLFLAYPGRDIQPRVFVRDALGCDRDDQLQEECRRYGIIATNPPWGARIAKDKADRLKSLFPDITSGESFSYFLRRSLDFLVPDGVASFILPESCLATARHQDIRTVLSERASIRSVKRLDRVFSEVFTPALRLDIALANGSRKKRDNAFTVVTRGANARIIDKLHQSPHVFLAGNAEWAMGIVTGDNRRHLSSAPGKGLEPVYRGRDLEPFRFGPARVYLRFRPEVFQQTAPESLYRHPEKLVYRFVSKRLVFAVDRERRLTLNSANTLIPRLPDYPPPALAALFNSTTYQFLYANLFPGLKVLRSHIERLPVPLWDGETIAKLAALAESLAAGDDRQSQLDELIMNAFGLGLRDRRQIFANA